MVGQITPTSLKARLDAGESLVILDVREPSELALAALPGVVHIPMQQVPGRLDELDPDAPRVGTEPAAIGAMVTARGLRPSSLGSCDILTDQRL